MKIAQVAPLIESVPPTKYGGTERVVSALTEALVARGHDVTLFASGNSRTSGRLHATTETHLREHYANDASTKTLYTHLHLGTAYGQQDRFDIIHDHTGTYGAPFAQLSLTPSVITLHGVIHSHVRIMFQHFTKPALVTISNNQRKAAPGLNYEATIYNGLDFRTYPQGVRSGKYLLFVGRICPQKGVHIAIESAQKSGLPLIIAAKYEPHIAENKKYFESAIQPKLSNTIRFIGEVNETDRNALFRDAIASLHPATWEEPFGLTLIESMACGAPVIALNRGSIPEIIRDGVGGFAVETPGEIVQAIGKIGGLSRTACAAYARGSFSADRMAQGYEKVYMAMLTRALLSAQHAAEFSSMAQGTKFSQLHYRNN